MSQIITLEISHPVREPGPLDGFRFFWAFRVSGFRPDRHCQPCFRGTLVSEFSPETIRTGSVVQVKLQPQHRYLYVCGVGSGPKSQLFQKNFHLPLRYEPGASVSGTTYNGYIVSARDAIELPIPPLEAGWGGRDEETTRCKNFQFGVAYFGAGGGQWPTNHLGGEPGRP